MGFYQFKRQQIIKANTSQVWDFISSPANLKKITPPSMGFDITNEVPPKMYAGMIISYKVKPLFGIPTTWVTEITHVIEKKYFVDEQRVGPYKMWHHQHHIEPVEDGTLMKDIISYSPPLGVIGSFMNFLIINKKLKEIFDYRSQALIKEF